MSNAESELAATWPVQELSGDASAAIRGTVEGYGDSRPKFPYPEGVT